MKSASDLAYRLKAALESAEPIDDAGQDLVGKADPYDIQRAFVGGLLERGAGETGYKVQILGRTVGKSASFGEAVVGRLTTAHALQPEQCIDLHKLIAPAAQPVLAFRLAEPISRTSSIYDVAQAISAVYGCLEVVDFRFKSKSTNKALVVADNALAARFALTARYISPAACDLSLLGCTLRRSGAPLASAAGAAVLGNPLEAVLQAAKLHPEGELDAGSMLLTGNLLEPVEIKRGDYFSASFGRIGEVTLCASA